MNIIKIILFFILPANLVWLVLLKFELNKKIGNLFSLFASYGIGPLINGLIFYYLIWFFPKRNGNFYIVFIFLFWSLLLLCSRKKIKEANVIYRNIAAAVIKGFSIKKYGIYFIVFFFTFIFSIQALLYPISENDSAFYFAQSEALHQSKDARWYEAGEIMLNGSDVYSYNKMIRPGIPATMAFTFLFGQKESNYFMFNFFFVYYYYLLIGMLVIAVSGLAVSLGKNQALSKFLAFLFFVFYWNMTRFYIFNNKEVVIFFLALAGIYLVHILAIMKKRNIKIEFLLGAILGLNAFVNLHGILIGIFLLCVLFIFSELSFWQRVWQVVFIFSGNLFFSAFEFVQSFGFIFLNTFRNLLRINTENNIATTVATNIPATSADITVNTTATSLIVSTPHKALLGDQAVEVLHAQMYQMDNLKDIYLKGKLQMLTNVGSYGFYFLFFLSVLVAKFKEITASVFGKIILLFMAIYYLVIIDPFNLNKNDLAIVLSGSPKYSMLVVFFSIIVVSIYFDSVAQAVFKYIFKNRLLISGVSFALALLLYIFKSGVISLGLKIILGIVKIDRDISFYSSKIELFYYIILGFIVLFGVALAIFHIWKITENLAYRFFFTLCLLFMIVPFFIVNVGKVPLSETFRLLNENRENKLQDTIYFGDLFKVYYYAKNNLPKGTIIQTSFIEIYTYNDYFKLRSLGDSSAMYELSGDCLDNQELYRVGAYSLCQIKNPA